MRDALPQPAWLVVLVLAVGLPYVFPQPAVTTAGTDALVLFLGALSLVPLLGWLRVMSFTPPASAGAAAYLSSLLLSRGQSLPVAAVVGAAVGAAVAAIAALVVLRTVRRHLVWSSLVVALAVWALLMIRGSTPGLVQPVFIGIDLTGPRTVYLIGVIAAAISVTAMLRVARSRDGRLVATAGVAPEYAIRCGARPDRIAIVATALSGAVAGLAGVVISLQQQVGSPGGFFSPGDAVLWAGIALLGGAGWPSGALAGTIVATALVALTPLPAPAIGALALVIAALADRSLVGAVRHRRRQQSVAT